MKIENDTSDCAVLFLRSFRVQTWCKFGAKTYRTMQKLCNDMRRKRHKIAQNERFSTIFRGINASRKTRRDNYSPTAIIKKPRYHNGFRGFSFAENLPLVQVYFGVGFGASETAQIHGNFNRRYTQFWVCLFCFHCSFFLLVLGF